MISSEMTMLALMNCKRIHPTTADEVLGKFLLHDVEDLEEMAGTPSTVFNAQYAAWLKRNFELSKCLEGQTETFGRMDQIIQRLPDINTKPEAKRQRVRADISHSQAVA